MKMAKASEKDIEVAGNVMAILNQIDRDDYPFKEHDQNHPDHFDPDDFDHLRHFYDLIKSSLDDAPNWHGRVIGGMCYVILYDKNEIVDPSLDVLELHPKYTASHDRIAQLERELAEAKIGHARYEYMRKLTPNGFKRLWLDNLEGIVRFDDLIDAAINGVEA